MLLPLDVIVLHFLNCPVLLSLVRENQGLEGLGVKQGELGDDHEEDRNVEGKASILDPESLPTEVCDAVQPKNMLRAAWRVQ